MNTKRNRPIIIFLLLLVLVVVLAGTSIYFYQRSRRANDPGAVSQAETEALVREVGERMYLPEDEVPTVATVTDPDKLKGQAFFMDAKRGYKVLIYTMAKKAVLYDPTTGKIVNVAPINLGTNTPGTTTTP